MLQSQQILQERYQLSQQLGNNASRQTWLAEDLTTQPIQQVIVKLLPFSPQTQWDEIKLFEREAQVLKHLNHPRIPQYRDYFSVDRDAGGGLPYFALVQDYIPGSSLQQQLSSGKRFTEKQVKKIATQLLNILIYLHELSPSVLHRDIKPSNIICGKDGQIYLVDFGAVQDRAKAEGVTFTVVGTGGYAPPEQLWGRAVSASDLYALGATLIHLLTGTAPANLPQQRMRLQFKNKVRLTPSFADWLEKLVNPALERRFSQARQALLALQAADSSSSSQKTTSSSTQATASKARYSRIGDIALLQYAAVVLFALAVPAFVVQRVYGVGEGKNNIGTMNRAQQAYQLEYDDFADTILELGVGIGTQTENYEYSSGTTPVTAFHYATPRRDELRGYVGGVFLVPGAEATDEINTVAFMCEAQSPGRMRPAEPIVRGNVIECGFNTTLLGDSAVTVLDKDAALAYYSHNYAVMGLHDQALLVAESIDSRVLKEKTLKAITNQFPAVEPSLHSTPSFSHALEIIKTIEDTETKAWMLAKLARESIAARQRLQARQSLSQTLAVAKTINDAEIKAWVLASIARNYTAAGKQFQAAGIFAQAVAVAQGIQEADTKAMVLADIAHELAATGKVEQATGLFAQAFKIAQTMVYSDNAGSVVAYVARRQVAVSQYDKEP